MVRDGEGNEHRFMYDGMGRLLVTYTPKAWKAQTGESSYSYDFLDRLIDTKRPDGSHERQKRDGEGNIVKKIHPNAYNVWTDDGEGWEYTYDGENRLQTVTGPDGVCLASYMYDLAGNVVEETDAQGRTTYRKYTLHGQVAEVLKPVKEVLSVTLPNLQESKEICKEFLYQKTTYVYDKNHNLIQEQCHSGYWDKNGVLQEEDGTSLTVTFAYDK